MKLKTALCPPSRRKAIAKMLLLMKLTAIILFVTSLHVTAKTFSQRVTISEKNASVHKILREINQQTGYQFFYRDNLVAKAGKIDISVKDMPVAEVLKICFQQLSVRFTIENKSIKIEEERAPVKPSEAEEANIPVTGTVKDDNGNPIGGVSVVIKETGAGTTSDVDGSFSIDVKEGQTLEFTGTGYVKHAIKITNQKNISITLQTFVADIAEVVVVGYGSQKKSQVIGSVAQVGAEKLNNRSVPQLSQALTGQMPGVTIIQRSGQPGKSGGNISVRGVGSFGADPAALILLDGIPVASLDAIDPNDVESVSVLKDASSAAIYGARAANGVILVTTKTGKGNDRLKISYNGYVGVQKATQYPKQVDSWEYASLLNEAQAGSFTDEEIQKYKDGSDPDNYPNVNFVDAVLKKSAMQTGHNISLANSSVGTQYQLSFGYLYQNGIIAKNDYNRYNVRLSMINKIAKGLKLTTRLYGMHAIDNQPAPPATLDFNDMLTLIGQAVRYPAFYAGKLSNGDWGLGNSGQGTPLSMLNSESFYKGKAFELLINERADWEIVKNLTVSVIGGFTYNTLGFQRFLANQRMNSNITLGPGNLAQVTNNTYYKTLQQLIEYSKKIGGHEISLLAGHSFESFRFDSVNAYRGGFVTNQLTQLAAGDASSQTNAGLAAEYALDSYFGRLRYSFQDKYLLEGVIRRDGSSRFSPTNKYATFPAIALGWRISNERFIKDNFEWIDDLKLKASYGVLGNQNTNGSDIYRSNYPYQSLLLSGYNYPIGTAVSSGVAIKTLADSTIRWESTRTKDIGLEMTVLNKSLSIGISYFDRYSYGILYAPDKSVSSVLGYEVGTRNTGSLTNRGWEFNASYKNNINGFNYYASGNLTVIKNKVDGLGIGAVSQPNGLVGNGSTLFIGYPIDLYYGLVADGLFTDQNDIDSYAKQTTSINPKTQPGDIRYKDISGPDGKPDGQVDLTYDRAVLGSRIPKYTYGINLGGNYKGFDVSILLQGIAGVKGLLDNYAGFAFYVNGTIQRYQADGRWTKENPDRNATYPRLEVISNQGTANSRLSSFWLQNASYLRIKNIQLGYTVPAAVLKRAGIGGLRIYASAENFATFKKYPEGWDPEINSSGAYYPILANYTLGLNLNF